MTLGEPRGGPDEGSRPLPGRTRGLLLFCASALVFQAAIASGRIGNIDTFNQLVASVHLLDTGHLAIDGDDFESRIVPVLPESAGPSGDGTNGWVRSSDGDWYQAHDPGNKVLLTTGALASRVAGRQPVGQADPTDTTKVLANVATGAFAALLPVLLFLGLRFVMPVRRAMSWATLGLVATILLPYSNRTWDVYPAAVLVAGVAWLGVRRLSQSDSSKRGCAAMFVVAALASWFRFSLAAFLLAGCVLTEVVSARRARTLGQPATWWRLAGGTVAFAVVLTPVLVLNAAATGNPLRPPIATFAENQPLERFPLAGAFGLIGSPNRGLLWFSPILLLALWLPLAWRSLSPVVRAFTLAWVLPVGGYLLAVGSISNWGAFGWGPRYLVPVIPLLWLPVAAVGSHLLSVSSATRLVTVVLLSMSVIIGAVAAVTNWEGVAGLSSAAIARDRAYPAQIVETFSYVGRDIPIESDDVAEDGVDAGRWPDLALLHGARDAGVPDALGYIGFAILIAVAAALLRAARDASPAHHT
ncbi:MAG: hypothetical protein RIE08_05125 [Acidimicrobiales bacterium]